MLQDVAGVYQKHYIKRFSDVLVRAKVAKRGCLHRTGEGPGVIGMLYHQQEIHTCLTSDWQHSFSSTSVCQVQNLRMPQEVNPFPKVQFQGLIYAPIFQNLSICLQWMWEAWEGV